MSSDKNKIIMVNSFKGGTGKTSLALSYCVSEAIKGEYDMVFYLDVDILGTGTAYTLFEEKQIEKLKFLNEYNLNTHTRYVNEILFANTKKEEKVFYVALVNPSNRINKSYYGKNKLSSSETVSNTSFYYKIIEFISKVLSSNSSNLIVLDCSPGLSSFEVELMYAINNLIKDKKNHFFEEIYVTTFDVAHIRKTIDCLGESILTYKGDIEKRNIRIIMNDIHNYSYIKYVKDEAGFSFNFDVDGIASQVFAELQSYAKNDKEKNLLKKIQILYKQYEMDLCVANTITNKTMLINNIDAYTLNAINYKTLK